MAQKSLEIKGLSKEKWDFPREMWSANRLLRHTNSDFYGIRTPTSMPYEPFPKGGVVFNLLIFCPLPTAKMQGGSGTEPEPETGTAGTVFPGTERGTGTAGTVLPGTETGTGTAALC